MQKTIESQQNIQNSSARMAGSWLKKINDSLKDDYPVLILSVISFVILGIICFFGVTKNVTVAAFSLNEYEVGQIADRTIIADRTSKDIKDRVFEEKFVFKKEL